MLIQQILLKILAVFRQERTVSAAFHLLKGKRSGQTIHDVGLYKLYPFFGILPKLPRALFDEQIDLLYVKNSILIEEGGYYTLTDTGKAHAEEPFPLFYDGWHFRGNEHVFFGRLSLVVQSLSHQLHDKKAFIPIEKNEQIQQWVRQYLLRHDYQKGQLQPALYTELSTSFSVLSVEERLKDLLLYRLTGYNEPGFTWQQLAFGFDMQELDIQLLYISGLHSWLHAIQAEPSRYPLLYDMTENIRAETFLTASAYATAQLYKKGKSVEEISLIRGLKMNTIEDHLVELAMNEAEFCIAPFVSPEQQQQVAATVEAYETKRLKTLKELLPHLSYFQLRLTLAKGVTTA